MDNPGIKDLGTSAITAALTGEVITSAPDDQGATQGYIANLEGMLAATISVNFVYGSGGTTCIVTIETSLDQGTTWTEVARFAFATASEQNQVNLSGLTPVTTVYTPAALSSDTVKDGIFGDRWRAKVTSTGTYAGNTSVAVRLNAR
jgi:hypothetical protein